MGKVPEKTHQCQIQAYPISLLSPWLFPITGVQSDRHKLVLLSSLCWNTLKSKCAQCGSVCNGSGISNASVEMALYSGNPFDLEWRCPSAVLVQKKRKKFSKKACKKQWYSIYFTFLFHFVYNVDNTSEYTCEVALYRIRQLFRINQHYLLWLAFATMLSQGLRLRKGWI